MHVQAPSADMAKNVALYPWFKAAQNLIFWQAVWFLYFQNELSAGEAILLYAIYDVGTTALEVPSGYMSDRLGRRFTLIAASVASLGGAALLAVGDSFAVFALAQVLLGAGAAFASGTDSALLYESLAVDGRKGEIEREELRAWRFTFVALAISAVLGGAMALWAAALPFAAAAVVMAVMTFLAFRFREPPRAPGAAGGGQARIQLAALGQAFREPVLLWLFWLSVLMYTFSHIPFVFGQPFILEALRGTGLEAEAPLVSGSVSSTMMVLSVGASLLALGLRRRLGLSRLLLLAFAMQIGLIGALALSNDAIAIALLFLRMVPDALSRPFILARIQPLLSDVSRATYMSLQSFAGRLLFAATLVLASGTTSDDAPMPYDEIQGILVGYVLVGLLCLGVLALMARRHEIDA
ncbi:MAG: MFS transporter [Pseudomonadota bacterium]